MPDSTHLRVIDHPLAQHALGQLRDETTPAPMFRHAVNELTRQLLQSATVDLPTTNKDVQTPVSKTPVSRLTTQVSPVAILRSGAAMLEPVLDAVPTAKAGHFGIYHDKRVGATVEYYLKLPSGIETSRVLLLDPAIGTGKTALACLQRLSEFGVDEVHFLTFVASRSGIDNMLAAFPSVHVHTISATETVDESGYLSPGFGDFGDRYYGSR